MLLDNWKYEPTVMCMQKSADKVSITEDLLRKANKLSFGNEIGAVTNRATSMFDLLPLFDNDSKEHKELLYRIMCIQHYQQNSIDKTKGIITKPMPKHWYQKIKPKEGQELSEEDKFNNSICADKKPYFMIYIYPDINKKYKDFIKKSNETCQLKWDGLSLDELLKSQDLTDEQVEFIKQYYYLLPVNDNGCVMNRLCHMVEKEFKDFKSNIKANSDFDYSIMKSGNDYNYQTYLDMLKVYQEYTARKDEICKNKNTYKVSREVFSDELRTAASLFKEKAEIICPNAEELCDIVLDICYTNNKSKGFAWDMCSEQIINNLLKNNGYKMKYIVQDDNGDIQYDGLRFSERIYDYADNE